MAARAAGRGHGQSARRECRLRCFENGKKKVERHVGVEAPDTIIPETNEPFPWPQHTARRSVHRCSRLQARAGVARSASERGGRSAAAGRLGLRLPATGADETQSRPGSVAPFTSVGPLNLNGVLEAEPLELDKRNPNGVLEAEQLELDKRTTFMTVGKGVSGWFNFERSGRLASGGRPRTSWLSGPAIVLVSSAAQRRNNEAAEHAKVETGEAGDAAPRPAKTSLEVAVKAGDESEKRAVPRSWYGNAPRVGLLLFVALVGLLAVAATVAVAISGQQGGTGTAEITTVFVVNEATTVNSTQRIVSLIPPIVATTAVSASRSETPRRSRPTSSGASTRSCRQRRAGVWRPTRSCSAVGRRCPSRSHPRRALRGCSPSSSRTRAPRS